MAKWEDYCITKLTFDEQTNRVLEVVAREDFAEHLGEGMIKPRSWIIEQAKKGITFCIGDRTFGGWTRIGEFRYNHGEGNLTFDRKYLPKVLTKRKCFLSFYHLDDEKYRLRFERIFSDLMVNKCVEDGDIDSQNSDEYIKKLIQHNHLEDTTVLIVLIGPNTRFRKHVDWEISGALNVKVGDRYSGLLGIVLPNHPDHGTNRYHHVNLPQRFAANWLSGYAELIDWTDKRCVIQDAIERAFEKRSDSNKIVNKSVPQMTKNGN